MGVFCISICNTVTNMILHGQMCISLGFLVHVNKNVKIMKWLTTFYKFIIVYK